MTSSKYKNLPVCDICSQTQGPINQHLCRELFCGEPDQSGPACGCDCQQAAKDILRKVRPYRQCNLHNDHGLTLCTHSCCRVTRHWFCSRLVTRPHIFPDPEKAESVETIPTTTHVTASDLAEMKRKEELQSLP